MVVQQFNPDVAHFVTAVERVKSGLMGFQKKSRTRASLTLCTVDRFHIMS